MDSPYPPDGRVDDQSEVDPVGVAASVSVMLYAVLEMMNDDSHARRLLALAVETLDPITR